MLKRFLLFSLLAMFLAGLTVGCSNEPANKGTVDPKTVKPEVAPKPPPIPPPPPQGK